MHLRENEGIEANTFVVTCGLGFVGSALCLELVHWGARRSEPSTANPPFHDLVSHGVHCVQGDLVQQKMLKKPFVRWICVCHLASYGMSGKEMLHFGHADQVNINGTCHVLEACVQFEVTRLVYASTYSVVFGGKKILNVHESLPYSPLDNHVDSYG